MLKRGAESFNDVERFDYYNRDKPGYKVGTESFMLSGSKRSVRWRMDLNNLADPGDMVIVTKIFLGSRGS